MSRFLIEKYYGEVERLIQFGGSSKETTIRIPFQNLLNEYCKKKEFFLIPELDYKTKNGKLVYPDGTVKDSLRLDWGYWESKDEADDIDIEIQKKFDKGYPNDNILFEDSKTAVLYQGGIAVERVDMDDPSALDKILNKFIGYERPLIREFREAIEKFKEDIPRVAEALRDLIEEQAKTNKKYIKSRDEFYSLCKQVINPDMALEDVREMLVQHILTEDIFNTVFDENQFHRENNIARQLEGVLNTFFFGATKRNFLENVHHYYSIIKSRASGIANHSEKQKFLKVIYENFYKAYSPKKADRLGVVYTPNEIVRFMLESADYLCYRHFGKMLQDKNVEILDPATGTGTYITELIEYLPKSKLDYKYKNEIHANEVEILPYYIANLNIEYTYKQKMGKYEEFKNICFVDTLDNLGFTFAGKQEGMDFGLGVENRERIKKQNERKISVIIGNPPYNANQLNENENNKNREYPEIDKAIKKTYVEKSKAQKSKQYDMYKRFIRWASDRIKDYGIIAFITNRSFIDKVQDDGFRKIVNSEFKELNIIDLGGDIRLKQKGNVFDIKTGVAISFFIKDKSCSEACVINYKSLIELTIKEEKFDFLLENKIGNIDFNHILPDSDFTWINQINTIEKNEYSEFLKTIDKQNKLTKSIKANDTLFYRYSNGISTNRDEWVYDHCQVNLSNKLKYFIVRYNELVVMWKKYYYKEKLSRLTPKEIYKSSESFIFEKEFFDIKWSSRLKRDKLLKFKLANFNEKNIINVLFRPFSTLNLYYEFFPIDLRGQFENHIPWKNKKNKFIIFSLASDNFHILASEKIFDLHCTGDSGCLPLYRMNNDKDLKDNISEWGFKKFHQNYNDKKITKEDIFHYVYGVLHNPVYRKKYQLNLKRDFPRIPFYDDFWKWCKWGKELMDLHINFEEVEKYPLEIIDNGFDKPRTPNPKLKADKENGIIILDEKTSLKGVPKEAWEYMLGNRCALEWILDQYKEKKIDDPTIREKFNTYKFSDYKEKVIDLLMRVTTVSIETVKIVKEMEK